MVHESALQTNVEDSNPIQLFQLNTFRLKFNNDVDEFLCFSQEVSHGS